MSDDGKSRDFVSLPSPIGRRLIPATILIGAIMLLQWHGWHFWKASVGGAGWLWSVLLELAALWLWWDTRRTRRALGALASLLLLIGPLYTVVTPLVGTIETARQAEANREAELEILRQEVKTAEEALSVALRNSEKRPGWAPLIQSARNDLMRARDSLRQRMNRHESPSWQGMAVIVMQCCALVLYQVAAVMAIRALAGQQRLPLATAPASKRERKKPLDRDSREARALALHHRGLSQRRIAKEVGMSQATVSRLLKAASPGAGG